VCFLMQMREVRALRRGGSERSGWRSLVVLHSRRGREPRAGGKSSERPGPAGVPLAGSAWRRYNPAMHRRRVGPGPMRVRSPLGLHERGAVERTETTRPPRIHFSTVNPWQLSRRHRNEPTMTSVPAVASPQRLSPPVVPVATGIDRRAFPLSMCPELMSSVVSGRAHVPYVGAAFATYSAYL